MTAFFIYILPKVLKAKLAECKMQIMSKEVMFYVINNLFIPEIKKSYLTPVCPSSPAG